VAEQGNVGKLAGCEVCVAEQGNVGKLAGCEENPKKKKRSFCRNASA
jgi:hypothetical protein